MINTPHEYHTTDTTDRDDVCLMFDVPLIKWLVFEYLSEVPDVSCTHYTLFVACEHASQLYVCIGIISYPFISYHIKSQNITSHHIIISHNTYFSLSLISFFHFICSLSTYLPSSSSFTRMKSISLISVTLVHCLVTRSVISSGENLPPLVGGRQKIDVNNSFLLDAVAAVKPQMLNSINSKYIHRMGKITEAYSQVVSGLKFYVTLEIGQTNCLKTVNNKNVANIEYCLPNKTKLCDAEIWVQTWLNHNELLKFTCNQ